MQIYREAFVSAGRDPQELIVKSHVFPHRTDPNEIDWDQTFSNVPAMLATAVMEFAYAMPVGLKSPMSLSDIARFMQRLADEAQQL